MKKIQITVLKTAVFEDLQVYSEQKLVKCPRFAEGQVFNTTHEKPVGFCDWAWKDIHPIVTAFITGGNFSKGLFDGWMKDENTMIACCTDGMRPVIFEIKRILSDAARQS